MNDARPGRLLIAQIDTPLGETLLVTDEAGRLRALDYVDHTARMQRLLRLHYPALSPVPGAAPIALRQALDAYFAGELPALETIAWATAGTVFQRRVWAALGTIPAGQTLSYGALAVRIGAPAAVRSVGAANGANPVGIVVPCHRLLGANGALTGYGGGLERKRWLLDHEARAAR